MPTQWAEWFKNGLTQWYDPQQCWLAFDPVRDRFGLGMHADRIEGQLATMIEALPKPQQIACREGLRSILATNEFDAEWYQPAQEISDILEYRAARSDNSTS